LISTEVTNATFGGCPAFVLSLVRPDGSLFGNTVSSCNAGAFLDAQALDQTGTWNVLVDPQGMTTGTATLQAWDASDSGKPINLNGASINASFVPGQNGTFTFSGTTGQAISATLSNSTLPGCPAVALSLVRPDGTTLGSPVTGCGANTFLDAQTLDQTGTWGVRVDPQGAASGTATLDAYDASDQVRAIVPNGAPVGVTISQPGQNAELTFTGSVGEAISAQVSAATFTGNCPTYQFSLIRPDGTTLGSPVSSCTATATLPSQTLDQNGTWTFLLDPQSTTTGTATVQAFITSNDTRPIPLNGAPLNFNLNQNQTGIYTFSGTTGQQVSATITNSTFTGCPGYTLSLQRPDGTSFGTVLNGCTASAFLDSQTLDQTGTWAFIVQPQANSGTGTIGAYTFSDLTAPADLTGKPLKLVFTQPGQNARLTFTGTTGEQISAYITGASITGGGCPTIALSLLRPNGTTLAAPATTCTTTAFLDTLKLDQTGTWTVLIDPQSTNTGTLTIQTYQVTDDVRTISTKGTLKSFTAQQPGANGRYTFSGTTGQSLRVTVSYSTFTGCPAIVVSFIRPDGSTLSTTSTCNANLVLGPSVLDATGKWTVFVDPQGPATGTLVIKLTS
jgi:hypothetical protein